MTSITNASDGATGRAPTLQPHPFEPTPVAGGSSPNECIVVTPEK